MRPASLPTSSYVDHRSPGSRISALLLSLAITALIVLALLRLGILPPLDKAPPGPTTLTLLPEGSPDTDEPAKPVLQSKRASSAAPTKPPTPPKPAPAIAPATAPVPPLNLLYMSKADLAAADISTKPTRASNAAARGDAGDNTDPGSHSHDTPVVGTGPHGEPIYDAELLQSPTAAQWDFYMPAQRRSGWGELMCRMNANNALDDCQEIGESPGSGLGRMLRQAAWIFKVRPPRVGGHAVNGALIRIHFTFTLHNED